MKKVFFIGFNKTATTAFHKLFLESGYKSWHNKRKKIKLVETLYYNLQNNLPVLFGIDDGVSYLDLGGVYNNQLIEGCAFYKEFYKEYPNSYFVLQTRSKEKWINSRYKWNNLPQRHAEILGISVDEVIHRWKEEWDVHHNAVRNFFKNRPNFIEYNIEKDNIEKLIHFLHKDFVLNKECWKKRNVTK